MWLSTIKFCHFNFIVDSVFFFVCRDNLFSSRFIRCYFHWVHSRGSVVVAAKLSRSRCHFSYGLLFSFCSHIAILVIQTQWKCIWKIIFYFVNFLFATCHRIFDFLVAVLPILLFYMIILVYMFCGRYLEILFCYAEQQPKRWKKIATWESHEQMNKRSLHTFIRNINGSLQSKQRYEIYTEIDTVIAMNFIVVIRKKLVFDKYLCITLTCKMIRLLVLICIGHYFYMVMEHMM